MSEYMDLINKEKQEALSNYDEKAFRLELMRKISEESKPSPPKMRWIQRPAMVGSALLLIFFLGWLATEIFLPLTQETKEALLKDTFVQLFIQHGTLLDQRQQLIEEEADNSEAEEFEWTIKRILYAIQREKAQDSDISESLNRVLQKAALLIKGEKHINGERNI